MGNLGKYQDLTLSEKKAGGPDKFMNTVSNEGLRKGIAIGVTASILGYLCLKNLNNKFQKKMGINVNYPATFVQDGDYILVDFPDIPAAFTLGIDMEEAYIKAKEVLELVLSLEGIYHEATPIEKLQLAHPDKKVILISVNL